MVVGKPKEFLLVIKQRCELRDPSSLIEQSQWGKKFAKNAGKKHNLSSSQKPPDSTPYSLTTATLTAHYTLFLLYKWIYKLHYANCRYCQNHYEILEYSMSALLEV